MDFGIAGLGLAGPGSYRPGAPRPEDPRPATPRPGATGCGPLSPSVPIDPTRDLVNVRNQAILQLVSMASGDHDDVVQDALIAKDVHMVSCARPTSAISAGIFRAVRGSHAQAGRQGSRVKCTCSCGAENKDGSLNAIPWELRHCQAATDAGPTERDGDHRSGQQSPKGSRTESAAGTPMITLAAEY